MFKIVIYTVNSNYKDIKFMSFFCYYFVKININYQQNSPGYAFNQCISDKCRISQTQNALLLLYNQKSKDIV